VVLKLSACHRPNFPMQGLTVVTAQPTPVERNVYDSEANQTPAADYLKLTIVGIVVCCFLGDALGMLLLVAALVCSIMVCMSQYSDVIILFGIKYGCQTFLGSMKHW